jgi:hypothetical protein
MTKRLSLAVVLFEGFELLDVFGPLEMFGLLPEQFEIFLIAENRDIVEQKRGSNLDLTYYEFSSSGNSLPNFITPWFVH